MAQALPPIWTNHEISVEAAFNPAVPREYGLHIVVLQNMGIKSPWINIELYGTMSMIAAEVSKHVVNLGLADWVNIQFNGNQGVDEGKTNLHLHIFGRLRTDPNWGEPISLPHGPDPYGHEPMTPNEVSELRGAMHNFNYH